MKDVIKKWYEKKVFPYLETLATSNLKRERHRLLALAEGHLMEIGAGAGQNVDHLPPAVKRYVAIEPSTTFIKRLRKDKACRSGALDYLVLQGKAEAVPHPSDIFDTVVSFLVLCSVIDPVASLSEIFRILKPGGRFLFFEHVLAERPETFRKQQFFNSLWKHIACGCELVRNTPRAIESAGFEFQRFNRYRSSHMGLSITAQVIEGMAIKPFHF
ncbi:class I SAM-dependent methyltransferase [Desulfosarcina sp.]|uniref:class I SAM-dependent methyltransferase n=1 Tax=Desulfosarcina sp. TaxID=2027861 RepID=UPI003566B832